MKGILLHVGALAVSSVLALSIWLRDEEADKPQNAAEVQIWSGRPELVESVTYESKTRKVRLEPKQDAQGRWYVTHFEKIQDTPEPPPGHPPLAPDAGAPNPASSAKSISDVFVAVKEGEELVKKVAPMMALRSIGKVDAKRAEEYGLDKPEGTLKVKIGGKDYALAVGVQTPGGGERYAKYLSSGEVFAIPNELTQVLNYADTRLMERELHGFAWEDADNLKISKGAKSRSLTRVDGKRDAWADASTPTKIDETLVNWLTKLERVRIVEYVEKPPTPPRPEDLVVRVDYADKSKKNLGFLEIYKVPGKDEYLARTEYVRWYTKVVTSAAEQVDKDLGALLK